MIQCLHYRHHRGSDYVVDRKLCLIYIMNVIDGISSSVNLNAKDLIMRILHIEVRFFIYMTCRMS
jgi:hypothetical protein